MFQVDQRIRRLDSEIARFKAKIQLKAGIRDAAINTKKKSQLKKGLFIACFYSNLRLF